jgi:hypothetical protein
LHRGATLAMPRTTRLGAGDGVIAAHALKGPFRVVEPAQA